MRLGRARATEAPPRSTSASVAGVVRTQREHTQSQPPPSWRVRALALTSHLMVHSDPCASALTRQRSARATAPQTATARAAARRCRAATRAPPRPPSGGARRAPRRRRAGAWRRAQRPRTTRPPTSLPAPRRARPRGARGLRWARRSGAGTTARWASAGRRQGRRRRRHGASKPPRPAPARRRPRP